MQANQIDLALLQPMLESATNALDKGQAQFFTPPDLAADLCRALPALRPVITDLNCGAGHLLAAAANATTKALLGCDIDPSRGNPATSISPPISIRRVAADLTLLYPLLREIDWRADLFVLNPPWDLHWHKERLKQLADSEVAAVREAFAAVDPRVGHAQIDSTIATWLIALDRLTYRGEGLLIGNHSTMERLVFGDRAPFQAMRNHVWARRLINGNPMTVGRVSTCPAPFTRKFALDNSTAPTAIEAIYFLAERWDSQCDATVAPATRHDSRYGPEISCDHQAHTDSARLWDAAGHEWRERHSARPPRFNLSLDDDGNIRVHLSVFKQSLKIDRDLVKRLFALQGCRPLQLVMRRETRQDLASAMALWTVDPKLTAAVAAARLEYDADRAPLYPLSEIQRLGYLEEEDRILCKKDLNLELCNGACPSSLGAIPTFLAGQTYALRSSAVPICRVVTRPNLNGEPEDLLLTGKELAIYISPSGHSEPGTSAEICFLYHPELASKELREQFAVLDLRVLADHFHIPDVPDVSKTRPEAYAKNLALIEALETRNHEKQNPPPSIPNGTRGE